MTMDYINERWARALLTYLSEPGDLELGALVQEQGAVTALYLMRTGVEAAIARRPTSNALRQRLMARWPRELDQDMSNLEHWYVATVSRTRHLHFVVPGDPDWPARLDALGDAAPFGLWVRSELGANAVLRRLNTSPTVGIVGARAATSYGEHVAMDFASSLVGSGVVIVSGAAYGIDGAAHRAALAAGGLTIAFVAGGVDRHYPAGNSEMMDRIVRSGAIISEVPPGSAPTKWRFLGRNRLIAAASDVTVVVEAGYRSGSLNTAGHARSINRPLGAVPGPITSAASAGCHRMLRELDATCISSVADIVAMLPAPVEVAR